MESNDIKNLYGSGGNANDEKTIVQLAIIAV